MKNLFSTSHSQHSRTPGPFLSESIAAGKSALLAALMAAAFSMAESNANAAFVTYNGTIAASVLGNAVTTDLPDFNSSLGTLTAVHVTLDFSATPTAQIFNFSGAPRTFTASDSVSHSYDATDTWTFGHGADSWTLTAPVVTSGTFFGSGQILPNFTSLTFTGATSAAANLTGASGLDFASYVGSSNLVFSTAGPGQSTGTGPFFTSGGGAGGGANLAGTASITYDYAPVPEPSTMALMGLCGLAVVLRKRKQR